MTPEICGVIQGIRDPQRISAQKITESGKKTTEYLRQLHVPNKIPGSEVLRISNHLHWGNRPKRRFSIQRQFLKKNSSPKSFSRVNSMACPPCHPVPPCVPPVSPSHFRACLGKIPTFQLQLTYARYQVFEFFLDSFCHESTTNSP